MSRSPRVGSLRVAVGVLAASFATSARAEEWVFPVEGEAAVVAAVAGGPSLHSQGAGAPTEDGGGRLVGSQPWSLEDESARPPLPSRDLHVSAWVRVDRPEPWAAMVSALEDNGSFERGFVLGTDSRGTHFLFGVAGSEGRLHYLTAPGPLVLGSWHHVVGCYDGAQQRLFVDGVEAARAEEVHGDIVYTDSIRLCVGAYRDANELHRLQGALGSVGYGEGRPTAEQIAAEERQGRPTRPVREPWSMDHDTKAWASYRGNAGRTGYTSEPLGEGLRLAWRRPLSPPSPAWPPPARGSYWQNLSSIAPRVVDDRALHPVIAQGRVLIASSSDLSLQCFDLESGRRRWRWIGEAPLRYAPAVADGRVLVGGDDGVLRCFELEDGSLRWSRRVAPEEAPRALLPGNGRLVDLHPIRTGLLVQGDRVFATAGLFPSQGVFAAALSLEDGGVVWRQSLGEHSPQGYLLATDRLLIVPGGRANPISRELETGLSGPSFAGVGGSYAVLCDDGLVAGRGNDGSFVRSELSSGAKLVQSRGEHLAVGPRYSFTAGEGKVGALDRLRLNELSARLRALEAEGREDDAARALARRLREQVADCVLWQREVEDVHELIGVGDELLVGRDGALERWSATTGRGRRLVAVDGKVLAIASAEGCLIATTDAGELLAFLPRDRRGGALQQAPPTPGPTPEQPAVSALLDGLRNRRGFAIVGPPPPASEGRDLREAEREGMALVDALLDASELQVAWCVDDRDAALRLRQQVVDDPRRAPRVSVHPRGEGGRLPFVDHVGTVVLDAFARLDREELERVATPGRGRIRRGDEQWTRAPLAGAGEWTHAYADLENTACGGDAHTTSELELQWFGGPGPERMIDRHLRGPPPLAAGGRVFLLGENRVIGVDAYNGVELWDRELPESQRYSIPYDCGSVACDARQVWAAVDAELWTLDAATGEKLGALRLPASLRRGHHWGYVGLDGDAVFGSAMLPSAPRTVPGRHLSDQTYRSQVPLVTSRAFFRVDRATGRSVWTRKEGLIVHPTIAVDRRRVHFVEARAASVRRNELGRLPLAELLAEDAWLVALDRDTGELVWEQRLELPRCRNVLYLSVAGSSLVLVGSWDGDDRDARYQVRVMDAASGDPRWQREHANLRPGELYHGEQVHHPVVLGDTLVAEPFLYDLATGELRNPGEPIRRPGHSCGTMSGSRDCLFFRAGNPTVLDLARSAGDAQRLQKLSPSRVGCWINILPVQGLVLIPEASASCVCHYALQTSMAFRPR